MRHQREASDPAESGGAGRVTGDSVESHDVTQSGQSAEPSGQAPSIGVSWEQVARAFARGLVAKADLLRQQLTRPQRAVVRSALAVDVRKFCDVVLPDLQAPQVSVAARAAALELGVDLCQQTWQQQKQFDADRSLFHVKDIVTVEDLVLALEQVRTQDEAVTILRSTRIAWILKAENAALIRLGFNRHLDDAEAAYREAGIELSDCPPGRAGR